ncbi:ribonuclease III [Candidatus Marinamargulisbacteria bacterium SCGC AAA071-K20]|nr:ribonuclease III [Candidatus Marinamargulisbacteria bacterium SCGC AAA071-K20]
MIEINKEDLKKINKFEVIIDVEFKNKTLIFEALTHSSYSKIKKNGRNNERLEFFGDAVLKLVISEYLFKKYPDHNEGKLTKIRAQLVADKFLKNFSIEIKLGTHLFLSKAEKDSGGQARPSNLANGFEAVLGAIYLDRGLATAKRFLLDLLKKNNINFDEIDQVDFKSRLQELLQKQKLDLPKYEVLKETGPEHNKIFEIALKIEFKNKVYQVKGCGISKKEAHQQAAKKMLDKLK